MAKKGEPKIRPGWRRGKPECHSCECGDHAWAPATKAGVVLVSPEDANLLRERHWYLNPKRYASAMYNGKATSLQRKITGDPQGKLVDHRNHNKLDNRRHNLRCCDTYQSMKNRRRMKSNSSGYKGVNYCKNNKGWMARIGLNWQRICLGTFPSPELAAAAYDEAARRLHGEFAMTNAMLLKSKEK